MNELIAKASDPEAHYRSPEKLVALKYTAFAALDLNDPIFLAARNEGIADVKASLSAVFSKYGLDALLYPTANRPAALIKPWRSVNENRKTTENGTGESVTEFADEAGLPDLVIPAGMTKDGLPVTMSFLGRAYRAQASRIRL